MKQIKVGVIVNTHGLKGEVRVKNLSDFPTLRYQKGKQINLQYKDVLIHLTIESVRFNKDLYLLTFKDYEDINLVEIWKGSYLSIDEDSLIELSDEEAYYFEMQDSEVYTLEEEYLGRVVEIIETGANAVLRVKNEEREILIPFVKTFVIRFDKKQKKMHVKLMEGLI
ncbi:MAG: ribosome maturation factor RimM [Longicatena sp.]